MPSKDGSQGANKRNTRSGPGREVTVSKAVSFILRHGAEREGLKLDSSGYANVADLVRERWQYVSVAVLVLAEMWNGRG